MVPYTIPALVSLAIIAFAVLLMTLAFRRFVKGDFKSILGWLLIGFWFMALPYTLFIFREIKGADCLYFEEIGWAIYVCMIIVGLCIFKAAHLLYEFSKVYGFAEFAKTREGGKGKKKA